MPLTHLVLAATTSVSLLAGYAREMRTITAPGDTAYGAVVGARAGMTLGGGGYVGGAFVTYAGTTTRASDATGASGYLRYRHAFALAPEVGWTFAPGPLRLRPYLAAGAVALVDRTAVRQREVRDDAVAALLAPGLVSTYRIGRWELGVDLHVAFAPSRGGSETTPTVSFVVGVHP